MIASLPMYLRDETAAACGRLWSHICDRLRSQGIDAPESLSRPDNLIGHWRDPELLMSQTCGLPLREFLLGRVTVIGVPDAGHRGCPAGHYFSRWVKARSDPRTRLEEFDGAALAFNDRYSRSGWEAPLEHARSRQVSFGSFVECGSHREAGRAVADGRADIAAIDAHSWKLSVLFDAFSADLRQFDRTGSTPGLPLITAKAELADPLRRAVTGAIAALSDADRELTACRGLVPLTETDFFPPGDPALSAA